MTRSDKIFRNILLTLLVVGILGALIIWWKASQPQVTDAPTINTTSNQQSCYTSQQAYAHIGESGCVTYYVGYPFRSHSGNEFLDEKSDFQDGFTAVIFTNNVRNFTQDPLSEYGYKNITVTGLIQSYQGHPEIIVQQESQISLE